jgi:hypothetical protein
VKMLRATDKRFTRKNGGNKDRKGASIGENFASQLAYRIHSEYSRRRRTPRSLGLFIPIIPHTIGATRSPLQTRLQTLCHPRHKNVTAILFFPIFPPFLSTHLERGEYTRCGWCMVHLTPSIYSRHPRMPHLHSVCMNRS